jgi:hypothetical protein
MPGIIPGSGISGIQSADEHAEFANSVAAATGIDPRVVYAWAQVETGGTPYGGFHNWLNLRPYPGDPYSGVSPGNFEEYSSLASAEAAAIRRIKMPFASGIIAADGTTPAQEISAIAASGWDAGHYGGPGGPSLLAAFRSIYPNVDTGGAALKKGSTVSAVSGGGQSPGSVTSVATGIGSDVSKFLEKWVVRGALIVLGTGLALVGLYLIARAIGAPSISPLDKASAVLTRGRETPKPKPRIKGEAAASRGEEVTTTSRPEPTTKSDRRQVRKNAKSREKAATAERKSRDQQYGDIPF